MKQHHFKKATKRGIASLISLVMVFGILIPIPEAEAVNIEVPEHQHVQVHQTSNPTQGSNYRNLSLNPGALNSEMRFTWHSGSPTGSIVITNPGGDDWVLESVGRVAEAHAGIGSMGNRSYLLPTRPGFIYYVHQVSVYDLAPQTSYTYVVTWEGGQSDPKTFRTGGNSNFSFLIAGDPQIGTGDGLAPTSATAEAAIDGREWTSALSLATAYAPHAEFILSVGDQIHTASGGAIDFRHLRISQFRHDRMFSPTELHELPLLAVVGNHDGWSFDNNNANPRLWPMHYNIPAPNTIGGFDQNNGGVNTIFRYATQFYTQFDYWVRWGNTFFIVLDSNVRTMSGARLDFFNAAVAENADADWLVATFHHPAYCVYRARNIAEKNEIVANWIPHFERVGIDVVLNGHAHVYNRTFQMLENMPQKDQTWLDSLGEKQVDETGLLYNAVLDPTGIVYFVFNSASGSGYYNVSNMPRSYIAAYNQNFRRNFSVADITSDKFSIRTYQINDDNSQTLVDVYTIVRSDEEGNVPQSVIESGLPQISQQVFERFTQPEAKVDVLYPAEATAEALGLPETIGVETNLFNNVGGNIRNIRPPNAAAAPTSYGLVVRTPRTSVVWDVEGSDFDFESRDAQSFTVEGTISSLPSGIEAPYGLLPYTVSIDVSVLPYGVAHVGDIARWMQYPPAHANHPFGMEAYFIYHGGIAARRPDLHATHGEAAPLQFWVGETQRMFQWNAGAPTVTQATVPGGSGGTGGLNNLTEPAFWRTTISTTGRAGIEVQFNMRSDPPTATPPNVSGPQDWQLQFSLDGELWVNADDPVILSGFWDNNIVRTLPSAADDQEVVHLRWLMASNYAVGGGAISATGRHHMRDVIIRSTVMPGADITDDEHTHIDVLMFNDLHGHISHGRPDDNNPGAARLAAYIQYVRNQNENPENVIVVGGGDDFHGYAVSTLLLGQPVVTMMTAMANNSPAQDYFQVAFGNHELSFGLERAIEIGTNPNISLLAADLVYAEGRPNAGEHPNFIRPYSIVEFENDISIALVGLMTSTMETVVGGWGGMGFHAKTPAPGAPPEYTERIAELIEYLREERGVDAVIGLTHKPAESASMIYVAQNLDFDGLFGAHRHARVMHVVNGVPIIEAAFNGRALGRLRLHIDENGDLVRVEPWISPVNAIRDFSRDRATLAGVDEYYDEMAELMDYYINNPVVYDYLNRPRGPVGIYFSNRAERDMWASRLVLDYVMRWAEDYDDGSHWIGVSNSGGWRNTGLWPWAAEEYKTYAHLLSTMPFDNNLLLFEMHGMDVIRLLERGGNVGNIVRSGVHQVDGNWYVTSSGERIPYDRSGTFNVIGSNFIFGGVGLVGGDGFPFPGNYHGDAANMQVLGEPRVVMRRMDGQPDEDFRPYITWTELNAKSDSSADWEELGVVMIRNALVSSTEMRAQTDNHEWQAELRVSAEEGGSAVITAPFAPGDRSRNVNIIPQWVTVTASGANFRGWFNYSDPENAEPLSEDAVFSFAIAEDTHLEARFGQIELEGETIVAWEFDNAQSLAAHTTVVPNTPPPAGVANGSEIAPTGGIQADTAAHLRFRGADPIGNPAPNYRALTFFNGGINVRNMDDSGNGGVSAPARENNIWWQTTISTDGFANIGVAWEMRTANNGARGWQLQYSTAGETLAEATDWTNVPNGAFELIGAAAAFGETSSQFSVILPESAEDRPIVHLRWLMVDNRQTQAGNPANNAAAAAVHQINNIVITGTEEDTGVISIADARLAVGTGVQVTVEGYITGTVGAAAAGAMQAVDASSPNDGIVVSLASASQFMGQRIQVTGYVQIIGGNLRITSVNTAATGNNVVATVINETPIQIMPIPITPEQATEGFDAMLVSIMDVEFGARAAGTGVQNHALASTNVVLRTNLSNPAALNDVVPGTILNINRGHVMNNLGGGTWRQVYSTTFDAALHYALTGISVAERITIVPDLTEPPPPPPVFFTGTNPRNLLYLLENYDVVLATPGNLGIFTQHSPFVIPAGRTLYVERTLNVQGNAELIIEGNVVVLEGGRINNQGGLGGTITIAKSGRLINYGHVENVTNSAINNHGTIINNARFEVRAGVTFNSPGYVKGTTPLNIHRNAIIID